MGCSTSQIIKAGKNRKNSNKDYSKYDLKVINSGKELLIMHNTQNMFTNEDILKVIAEAPNIKNLTKFTLAVENQEIESEGLNACLKWLKGSQEINELTLMLKNNEVDYKFADPLRSLILQLPKLTNLYLDFESNRLNSNAVIKLFQGQFSQSLKVLHLNLRDNDIDDDMNYSLAFLQKSQIEDLTINLEENQLEDETICEIIKSLSFPIKKLKLIFTCVFEGEKIMKCLADQIKSLTNLKYLDISSTITQFEKEDISNLINNMNEKQFLIKAKFKFNLRVPLKYAIIFIKQSILSIPDVVIDFSNQSEYDQQRINKYQKKLGEKRKDQHLEILKLIALKNIFKKDLHLINYLDIYK